MIIINYNNTNNNFATTATRWAVPLHVGTDNSPGNLASLHCIEKHEHGNTKIPQNAVHFLYKSNFIFHYSENHLFGHPAHSALHRLDQLHDSNLMGLTSNPSNPAMISGEYMFHHVPCSSPQQYPVNQD